MFSTRLSAVPLGMRTTARQPNSRAVQATPRPWLPSVAVKNTAFPSAARAASLLSAAKVISSGRSPNRAAMCRAMA